MERTLPQELVRGQAGTVTLSLSTYLRNAWPEATKYNDIMNMNVTDTLFYTL